MNSIMRSRALAQFMRYLVVGGASVASYVILLYFLIHAVSIPPKLANLASYSLVTVANYGLNYYWTFQTGKGVLATSWRYLTVVACGVALNYLFVAVFVDFIWNRAEVAALLFSALWPLMSFVSLKFWVFR